MCEDVLMGVPVLGARTWHTPQGSSSHRNAGGTAPYAAAAAISAEALKPDATVNCMLLCPAQNHTSPYSTSTIVMGFVPAVELVAVMVAGFSDLFIKEVFVECVWLRNAHHRFIKKTHVISTDSSKIEQPARKTSCTIVRTHATFLVTSKQYIYIIQASKR